ncbi:MULTISPECIES: acetyl-CoA carboxylase biotin carboxyl carrier protein [Caldisericum]|uniref:Biotin carboxyl carrier protein of acetyl-CoA carboxylase n=1 Tax=Caldisericum exile TaxID=693075 RepID=A0A2J6WG47_9BACT|nr:MAG: acetyl-CoA carboxylase, biotin carboxyl carrier protein [Caldisericum exile]
MKNKEITPKEIKEIIQIAKENKIKEFNLELEGLKIYFKFEEDSLNSMNPPSNTEKTNKKEEEPTTSSNPNTFIVKSPLVGVFYRKPNPNAKPYVEVGDVVEKGQTLCIIETMKIMNEIQAEKKGKVLRIFPEDSSMVEVETPLFELEEIYED